ncbi:hypothetical protein GQ457_06G018720 [Hibiscus cannabinus]
MSFLEAVDLSYNSLSSTMPNSLYNLNHLQSLGLCVFDVSKIQLNGTLPPSFGKLKILKTLDISKNLMKGVVSETHFSNLTNLTICCDLNQTLTGFSHFNVKLSKVSPMVKVPEELVRIRYLTCKNSRCG